jgi:hypothetical protein
MRVERPAASDIDKKIFAMHAHSHNRLPHELLGPALGCRLFQRAVKLCDPLI